MRCSVAQYYDSKRIKRLATVGTLLSNSTALAAHTANIRLSEWEKIAGKRLADKASPERLVDGVLTIRVPSSTWAQEMSMLSEMLLERLRAHRHPVRRLRFRVAPQLNSSRELPAVQVKRSHLPASLKEHIEQIADPELREVLQEAASYSLARSLTINEKKPPRTSS